MKAALLGVSKIAMNIAYTIKELSQVCENPQITISGIYSNNIQTSVNAAIVLNTKIYLNLKDLLHEADIIFISGGSKTLSSFTDLMRENRIRSKILCHFDKTLNSDILYCGTTNTYASFYTPFAASSDKIKNLSDDCIMVEGEGKRFEEFSLALTELGNAFKICTKSEKALAVLANRFTTDYVMSVLDSAIHMYKIAGVFSSQKFSEFVNKFITTSKKINEGNTRNFTGYCSPKANEAYIRKTFSLLNTINYSDLKSMYRVLETHALNSDAYTVEEKEYLASLLKRLR